jgi:photosystem II stability/assembly factor-like uncharacterized protein
MKHLSTLLIVLLYLPVFGQVKNIYPSVSAPRAYPCTLYAYDENTMFAGGFNGGYILKTIDGGNSWTPARLPGIGNVYRFFFTSELTGWAADGYNMAKTEDGGMQWDIAGTFSDGIISFSFCNDSVGVLISGKGGLYRTENGGKNWAKIKTVDGPQGLILTAVPYNTFIINNLFNASQVSTDGGKTWQQNNFNKKYIEDVKKDLYYAQPCNILSSSKHSGKDYYSPQERLLFNYPNINYVFYNINNTTLYDLSYKGVFNRYNASNQITFTNKLSFAEDNNAGMAFFTPEKGIVSVRTGLYKTTDGGKNWTKILNLYAFNDKKETYFSSIFFLNPQQGWATSLDKVYSTADGGKTWSSKSVGANLDRVHFFNKDTGLVTSYYDGLFKTTDGGNTWQADTFLKNTNINNAYCTDINNCWIISNSYFLYYTANFGNTWQKKYLPNDSMTATAVSALKNNPQKMWVATNNSKKAASGGALLYTEDGGNSWTTTYTADYVWNVQFVNDSVGWIGGMNVYVSSGALITDYFFLNTTDGGKTWNSVLTPRSGYSEFTFISENEGMMYACEAGGFGYIAYTDDGGQSWAQLAPYTELGAYGVAFWGKEQCWFITGQHQICQWNKMQPSFLLQEPFNFSTPEILTEKALVFSWERVDYVRDYILEFKYKNNTVKKTFAGNYNLTNSLNFSVAFSYNQTQQLLNSLGYDGTEDIVWQVYATNTIEPTVSAAKPFHIRPTLKEAAATQGTGAILFPNPASSVVTITTNGNDNLNKPFKAYNTLGQQFSIAPVSHCNCNQVQLDISPLASGIYFILVETESSKETLKLIKP